jgi:hypothetical protein
MTWPRTLGDLFHLAGLVAGVAQGVVFVLLALLLIAFIWWVFQVARHPEATVWSALAAGDPASYKRVGCGGMAPP